VEGTVRQVQQGVRHDLAEIGEDDQRRLEPEDVGDGSRVPQTGRGEDVEAELTGRQVDGRRSLDLAASDRAWRRGHDGGEIDGGMGGEPAEDRLGKSSAAEE